MKIISIITFLGLSAFALAANHQVIVGGSSGNVYTPSSLTATTDDTITFVFQAPGNHSVTQSAFKTPCTKLATGFDSGFVSASTTDTNPPAFAMRVTNTTAPIWFYSKQGSDCKNGMVGAINAPTTGSNTFEAFQALATSGKTGDGTTSGSPGRARLSLPIEVGVLCFAVFAGIFMV